MYKASTLYSSPSTAARMYTKLEVIKRWMNFALVVALKFQLNTKFTRYIYTYAGLEIADDGRSMQFGSACLLMTATCCQNPTKRYEIDIIMSAFKPMMSHVLTKLSQYFGCIFK